jgi:hypothetical protein
MRPPSLARGSFYIEIYQAWCRRICSFLFCIAIAACLVACQGGGRSHREATQANIGITTPSQIVISSAVEYLLSGRLDQATSVLNTGIKFDFYNAELHFLNALTYHQKYLHGQPDNYRLALSGYRIANRMDSELTSIVNLQISRLYMRGRDYKSAKAAAAVSVYADPSSVEALALLLQAAMLTKDMEAAAWAIAELEQRNWDSPLLTRLKAIYAALTDKPARARALGLAYSGAVPDESDASYIEARIEQLIALGNSTRPDIPVESGSQGSRASTQDEAVATAPDADAAVAVSNWFDCDSTPAVPTWNMAYASSGATDEMITADVLPVPCSNRPPAQAEFSVTLVATSEYKSSNVGINLLDGLEGIWRVSTDFNRLSTNNFVLANSIDISGSDILSYSLNIANSAYSKNDVFLHPTLSAIDKIPVVLYVGTTLTLGVGGDAGGSAMIVDRSVGVSLAITPTFLANEDVMVSLRLSKGNVVPTTGDASGLLLEQNRSVLTASAILGTGDTYILSGLTLDQTDEVESGVPGLQDIPILKRLFSTKAVSEVQVSLIALITYNRSLERPSQAAASVAKISPARAIETFADDDAGLDEEFQLERLTKRRTHPLSELRRRDVIADQSAGQIDLKHIIGLVLQHAAQP